MEGAKKKEFFSKYWHVLVSTFALFAAILTFAFFMMDMLVIQGESFSAIDMFKDLFSSAEESSILGMFLLVFGSIITGQLDVLLTTVILLPIYGVITIIFMIIFVVRLIDMVVTYIRACTKGLYWNMASERLNKRFSSFFSNTVWYIVLAYTLLGKDTMGVELTAAGIGFIALSAVYFVVRNFGNNLFGDLSHGVVYASAYIFYDVLKIAASIVIVSFFVKKALLQLIFKFTVETLLALLALFASEGSVTFRDFWEYYGPLVLLPSLKYLLAHSALKTYMDGMKMNMCNLDEEAKRKTRNTMIVMIVALALDLIILYALLPLADIGIELWKEWGGAYLARATVTSVVAFLVYFYKKLLAYILWNKYEDQRVKSEIEQKERAEEIRKLAREKKEQQKMAEQRQMEQQQLEEQQKAQQMLEQQQSTQQLMEQQQKTLEMLEQQQKTLEMLEQQQATMQMAGQQQTIPQIMVQQQAGGRTKNALQILEEQKLEKQRLEQQNTNPNEVIEN